MSFSDDIIKEFGENKGKAGGIFVDLELLLIINYGSKKSALNATYLLKRWN